MQVDEVLLGLKNVCCLYPSHFEGTDVGGEVALGFVHETLHQTHTMMSYGNYIPLCFSEIDFVRILSETFIIRGMSQAHISQVESHIRSLWRLLATQSSNSLQPYLIPITKIRFLTNMLQSHFPRVMSADSLEEEFVAARTKTLVSGVTLLSSSIA